MSPACLAAARLSLEGTVLSPPGSTQILPATRGLKTVVRRLPPAPEGEAATPPLPESTVPVSNGGAEGLSDLGTEDGWTVDAEADHSGGRRAWGVPSLGWERG